MRHTRAKNQGEILVGSKRKVETDGRMDTTGCNIFPAYVVRKNRNAMRKLYKRNKNRYF